MATPGEHKTVQARILHYAEEIGWTMVPTSKAETRRHFNTNLPVGDRAKGASLFFADVLTGRIRDFNPKYLGDPAAIRRRSLAT